MRLFIGSASALALAFTLSAGPAAQGAASSAPQGGQATPPQGGMAPQGGGRAGGGRQMAGGPDPARWQYGQDKFHYVLIEHPLSAVVNSATRAKLTAGPLPRGGDGATITATGNADNQNSGGSFKMIADTENWDNSIGINTPGQAGNPDDRHYRDLFELWARGRYFTLAYSKKAVESVKESVTLLDPQGATTQQRQ